MTRGRVGGQELKATVVFPYGPVGAEKSRRRISAAIGGRDERNTPPQPNEASTVILLSRARSRRKDPSRCIEARRADTAQRSCGRAVTPPGVRSAGRDHPLR